eukprot:1609656-Rhodomonas_salina.2
MRRWQCVMRQTGVASQVIPSLVTDTRNQSETPTGPAHFVPETCLIAFDSAAELLSVTHHAGIRFSQHTSYPTIHVAVVYPC